MTITQLIQAAPARANELFAKLADTSDGAVKTRERLLAELREELDLQAQLEEKHLFPALRKHKELKDLVADAVEDNKQTRVLLAELERMPKDDENFARKVTELRRVFQQHVRDDRKELLPAIRKVLTDEEAQAVTEKIEARKAEIEEAKREEAEQRRAAARREREAAERMEEEARAEANRIREASVAMARVAGKTVENAAQVAETGAAATRRTAEAGAEVALRGSREALGVTRRVATPMIDGIETLTNLPTVAACAANDAGRALVDWMETTTRAAVYGSRELSRSASPQRMIEVQGRLAGEAMRAWFDISSRLFEISMRASRDMLQPIERQNQRMKETAQR
ncbi:hemerythrin domain-containing protein [Azospirillum soli]|uniref:hemerythrin domain-containing protein n=1 Tax=Azospirillum soli TaxID=1304799 RepID=UPI001AE28144|nr:hemerythrin domain-containing protein [Azospirillum soli]MBP2313077.1 hypothetical protein [Azospirillum soli]